MKKIKWKKGVTLLEMVVVVAIVMIISLTVANLLLFPTKANEASSKEYKVQSALRYGSQVVNTSVRDASAMYLLTKEPPEDLDRDLDRAWNYLICEQKDGISSVVKYEWNKTTKKHVKKVIAEAKDENVNFSINFENTGGGKLLKYSIVANYMDSEREEKVMSEIKPLNSFNIVDNAKIDISSGKKVGNALAFRNDLIDPDMGGEEGFDLITVSLVLDVSGSMWGDMDGWYVEGAYESAVNGYRKPGDGNKAFFTKYPFDKDKPTDGGSGSGSLIHTVPYIGRDKVKHWTVGYREDKLCWKVPDSWKVLKTSEASGSHGVEYWEVPDSWVIPDGWREPHPTEPRVVYCEKSRYKLSDDEHRHMILRKNTKKLIEKLMTSENKDRIRVGIYPFSIAVFSRGNPPDKFKPKLLQEGGTSNEAHLKKLVDDMRLGGGTNAGDGVRWAYHDLLKLEKENPDKRMKHFVLLLTDGQPNMHSSKSKGGPSYYGEGNSGLVSEWVAGLMYAVNTAKLVDKFPEEGVDKDGNTVKPIPGISDRAEEMDFTIIGFSNKDADNANCDRIGIAGGAAIDASTGQHWIKAGSDVALEAAFASFAGKILDKSTLWYITAPK